MRLLDYAKNVNSQYGEDGILGKILDTLPKLSRWSVEFGAWDGVHLSNTRELVENRSFSGVFIEGDAGKFQDLVSRYSSNPKVFPVCSFVGFGAADNLDQILRNTPIPKDFDVLSIDIDGNDYHVWSAMGTYSPKVVCIEFNPTIPTEVEFVQPAVSSLNQGASLLSLVKLAKTKGYALVCTTHNNAVFVRDEFFALFGIADNDPRVLREDISGITHIFVGYDGTLFVTGREFLCHHSEIRIKHRIRQLPAFYRHYPLNFGPITRWSYKIYQRVARILRHA